MPREIDSRLHRTFLKRIKERRLELGLTQTDLASRLDTTQSAYADIEAGRRTPGLDLVERVAKALSTKDNKISAVDLLSEEPVQGR